MLLPGLLQRQQGLLPIHGQINVKACIAQQLQGHQLVEFVVFDQQHPGTAHRRQQGLLLGFVQIRRQALLGRQRAQRLDQGLKQHGGTDGFDEHGLNALGPCSVQYLFPAIGRDHQHLRHAAQLQGTDALRQLDAIHAGHLPIEQQQAVRVPLVAGTAHRHQGLFTTVHLLGLQTQRGQLLAQHGGGGFVVVHHQHPALLQWPGRQHTRRLHRPQL